MVLLACNINAKLYAQVDDNEDISADLTKSFKPTYLEFNASDSARNPSVNLYDYRDRKLVFYDNFDDNRHVWPYWTSGSDSIMRTCIGFADRKISRGKKGEFVNGFTNMEQGKKVLFAFTPEENLKYSNNVPVPLVKNYVITFNPLSIKQVSKLPSPYYEGYNEHTVRIHNDFNKKDFFIESNIEQAVGTWGMLFGNTTNMQPYYYFKINADNTYDLFAIYPQRKSDLVPLAAGNLNMPYTDLKNLVIQFKHMAKGGYRLEFFANNTAIGTAAITTMYLSSLDIGYRLDHNSIDGNNILIVDDLAVYEKAVKTYTPKDFTVNGKWHGGLYRNNKQIYKVTLDLNEQKEGKIKGLITFRHVKYNDVAVTKKFVALRDKNIINFEDIEYAQNGISNDVVLFSLLQKGNFEVLNPDSMVMQSFAANNLDKFGDFDPDFDVNSNTIYLSRFNRTVEEKNDFDELFAASENYTIEIENIYFHADEAKILENERTTQSLDQLARSLQKYLARNPSSFIIIHGHTDIGAEQILSLTRAFTIKTELMKRGVTADIFCVGHGSSHRLSERRGDAKNRRVELELKQIEHASYHDESIVLNNNASVFFINDLPISNYAIQSEFKLSPGKQYVIFKNLSDGLFKWEIPNTAGGAQQSLRILRRTKKETGEKVLEFWLDEVNVLTQSIHDYKSFGFMVDEGSMDIANINIFSIED